MAHRPICGKCGEKMRGAAAAAGEMGKKIGMLFGICHDPYSLSSFKGWPAGAID